MSATFIVVGAGQAGATAIESLRREGYDGRLVLVGAEGDLPYQRPPLSKKFLAGELAAERLLIKPASFYASARVELELGRRAIAIDRAARALVLDDGRELHYDRLLLATGAAPRRVAVPGETLDGVHYLRTRADVEAIRAAFPASGRLVVIGAGYIGLEVAATSRGLGLEVDVLELADRAMNRVVAPELSAFYAAEHARAGVRLHLGCALEAILGDGAGRVRAVVAGGRELAADLVVIGIGVVPETALAAVAGLTVGNGIEVDEHCRSDDPAIYAAGDCANQWSLRYGRRVRLESVDNAFEQAKTASANMHGRVLAHDRIPWFWSDQYDLKLLIVGLAGDHDSVVVRGDPANRSFSLCYLRGDELLALDAVNAPKDYMVARKLIAERAHFDRTALADAARPLRDCQRAPNPAGGG
jgi:3-phenylpropionate/trans-cinnamate dioxygenase ferredoxin reductase subunit